MDKKDESEMKYIIFFVTLCFVSAAHSENICDSGVSKKSFWWEWLVGSEDIKCEPLSDSDRQTRINTESELGTLRKSVKTTNQEMAKLRLLIETFDKKNSDIDASLTDIKSIIASNEQTATLKQSDLNNQLSLLTKELRKAKVSFDNQLEFNQKDTADGLNKLDNRIGDNVLYIIVFVLVLLIGLFYILRKKIDLQVTDIESILLKNRESLEEEFVRIDAKLIEIFETQINGVQSLEDQKVVDVDHTLVIKVADELVRIQKNITRMDEKTKGLKQLSASVSRIQDNVASNGYEIVDMLGMPYNEGMKVSANFVPDDDLEAGEQIITRVIKPQINYEGIMIQSAQIEVSQGE